MAVTKEQKEKIIKEFQINDKDCGSAQVQIAILTHEINDLTEHLILTFMISILNVDF